MSIFSWMSSSSNQQQANQQLQDQSSALQAQQQNSHQQHLYGHNQLLQQQAPIVTSINQSAGTITLSNTSGLSWANIQSMANQVYTTTSSQNTLIGGAGIWNSYPDEKELKYRKQAEHCLISNILYLNNIKPSKFYCDYVIKNLNYSNNINPSWMTNSFNYDFNLPSIKVIIKELKEIIDFVRKES